MSSHIQAVLFSTNSNNEKNKKWLSDNNLINIKPVHKTENYKRYRIKTPNNNKYFYRIQHNNKGPDFIIGIKK